MTRRVVLDVSSNNGKVDFRSLKAAHPELVGGIIKATEGNGYTNPLFGQQHAAARAAGLLTGAYSFMHPASAGTGDDQRFLNVISGHTLELGVWADCEITDGLDPATISARFQQDVQAISAAHPGKTGIYTGRWFWDPQTRGSGWAGQFPAWIANYGGTAPDTPYPWSSSTVAMWQFTDSYHGTGIDASVWWGDDTSWNRWVGGTAPTPPAPSPSGDDEVSVLPQITPAKDAGHPKACDLARFLIDQIQPGRDVKSPAALGQAVHDFQAFFKVPGGADGVLGANTWRALLAMAVHQ